MKETNLPKIIRAQKSDKNKIKGVLKLGFSSDPLIRWVFPDPNIYLESFDVWMEEFSNYHPDDAWYLAFIGVDPSKQGLGVGSFILKEALKHIDELGERAYLESSNPRNMSLYERHGFESMGKVQIGDSPPAHPMIREARK